MFAARPQFFYQTPTSSATSGKWTQATNSLLTIPSNSTLYNWKATTGWTCEYWVYVPSSSNLTYLATPQSDVPAGIGLMSGASCYWSLGLSPTLQTQFYYWGTGKFSIGTAANSITTDSWNNICVVVTTVGTTFTMKIFVNGVQQNIRANNTGSYASTYTNTNGAFGAIVETIGPSLGGNNAPPWYMDELRISNTARYSSDYTPATSEFTSDANTLLLIHFNGTNGQTTFTDSSSYARTISNPNSTKVFVSNAQGKF